MVTPKHTLGMTIGEISSVATLEVQPSGDQMKCRSKPLAKECRLIATPIRHDERTQKIYTGSGVARVTKARDGNWGAEDCRRQIGY